MTAATPTPDALRLEFPPAAGIESPTSELATPVGGFLKLIDTANGLVVREHPGRVFFANVDLAVHFLRQPQAGWVGFDTRVNFGPTGLGETFTVLSDAHGPVGTAAQSLTVRNAFGRITDIRRLTGNARRRCYHARGIAARRVTTGAAAPDA